MGSLTFPSSGLVYVDTQIVIYSVETHAPYWAALQPLWRTTQTAGISVVTSELTLMEALVRPLRDGDDALTTAYEQLFQSREIRLIPISRPILREAARLRAVSRLRTPDALHAAPAVLSNCAMFLTNDQSFRQISGLPVTLLSEVLAS